MWKMYEMEEHMGIQSSEWKERVTHWIRTLEKDLYQPLEEICWEGFLTMDQLSLEEAKMQEYAPVKPGFTWGHTWEYGWFRARVTMPKEAVGKRIVLDLKQNGEATLFVNDQVFGTYRADWIEKPHHYLVDNYLTRCAGEGQVYEIYMEVYAGHYFPTCEAADAQRATGPCMEGDYVDPLPEGARRVMGKSTFGVWNEDAYQLYMDVKTLESLEKCLDDKSLRAVRVAEALEDFTLTVDFEQPLQERILDYQKARERLRPALEARNGSTMPKFYAVGNAHIDLAWLWPFAETYRKTARTFAAQLRLLDEYPEYRFIQSQPASYEMCRKYYPELFDRILEAVKAGRWIADGAMWVEPDTNVTGGESLIRQLLYGKKYYKDVFGVDCQVLWLPDTFGYTGALPQLLRSCGVKYLVTQKIFWSYNGGEQFPYHYFTWEGIDGSKITSFLPTNYTYKTCPKEADNTWKNRSQMRDLEAFLYPFGYGDGGGGPCRDHIEYIRRNADLEGSIPMEMASPQQFFEDMDKLGGPKHTYVGELYFTCHRGTYTSQALMKKNNRQGEIMMHNLELWSVLASWKGMKYPAGELEEMWKIVLLHQFHDILPGTCIARVYEEAAKTFEDLYRQGDKLGEAAFKALTGGEGCSVFNPLGFARKAVVPLPEVFADGLLADGRAVPVDRKDGHVRAVLSLPALGAVNLVPAVVRGEGPQASVKNVQEGYLFENDRVQAVVDHQAEVISFHLKDGDRKEFAAGAMNHFLLYKDIPRRYDAWDIDSNYIEQQIEGASHVESCEILEDMGARAVLKVTGTIGVSTYTQKIVLEADSSRLEFRTDVDWHEQHRLLKVAFPVRIYADNGINEMQFGYVKRPTHRSRPYEQDRFEVCNHRYSALCDENHGAAVLNDCKYGISMNGNTLELTLLRAAVVPDRHADQGHHTFTYGFTAWNGSFYDCDVAAQGYELNVKPVVVKGGCRPFSLASVDKANIILESVKLAEDGSGDMILRLYEAKKAQTEARLTMNLDSFDREIHEVSECNLLEQETGKLVLKGKTVSLNFGPFEVKTIRVK